MDAAERMMALFAGHAGAHGTHGEPTQAPGSLKWEIKSSARTLRAPVTVALWRGHLAGGEPLGVVPVRTDGTCAWGSIDVDRYEMDLIEAVAAVEGARFPLVPCRSKSGGLHLFLFCDPQPAAAVQSVLRDMAARLGMAECEIFPKQTIVFEDRGDCGNWMVMPYYGGTFGGKLCAQVGINRTGGEQTLDAFLAHAEGKLLSGGAFAELGRRRTPRGNGHAAEPAKPFGDGPPCLQHMAEDGVPEHSGRNNALFMIGLYWKRAAPANWQARVEESNRLHMRPPLTSEEVQGTIKSLGRKDYEYTCKVQPMCQFCDAALCRTRKWGVGTQGEYPIVTALTRLETDPPIWFVDVSGAHLEVTTDVLLNYDAMMVQFVNQTGRVYRAMKRDAWLVMLREPMDNHTKIPAAPDAGREGQLMEVLEDLLVNRWRGEKKEDLLLGKPWEDEERGRHYFRLKDLEHLLDREKIRQESRPRLSVFIRRLGGASEQMTIKNKNKSVWWLPSSLFVADPTVDPPTPKLPPI